jgi:molybdopterin biosynthesis enzyme
MLTGWQRDWQQPRSRLRIRPLKSLPLRCFALVIINYLFFQFTYHSSMAAPADVLTFEEARRMVEDHAFQLRPKGRELLGLLDASGRVLAEPILADRDFPPFPRAARDGYAVRAADLETPPASLNVIGEIKAGAAPAQVLQITPGTAAAIMTGAAAPAGADAVVMVENVH